LSFDDITKGFKVSFLPLVPRLMQVRVSDPGAFLCLPMFLSGATPQKAEKILQEWWNSKYSPTEEEIRQDAEEVRQEWAEFLKRVSPHNILLHRVGWYEDLTLLFGENFVKAVPSSTGKYNYYFTHDKV